MDTPHKDSTSHTGLSPELEQQIRERFPVELNGIELAALTNTFSFAIAIATGNEAMANEIFPDVRDALNILGYEQAMKLMFALPAAAAEHMRGVGAPALLDTTDVDRSAVLGGLTANHTPGGIVS